MTGFLASVRGVDEAQLVIRVGADILDVKEPDAGALGAVPDTTLREVVDCARGVVPVSATIGDLAPEPALLGPAIARTWSTGVDIVKVGVFANDLPAAALALLSETCTRGVRIVLVYFAEQWQGTADFAALRRAGIAGVMLDTRFKGGGSLPQQLGMETLQAFVQGARDAALMAGLAGSLREMDIAPLLALTPDYLGFRGALCGAAGRGAVVDADAVCRIAGAVRAGGTCSRAGRFRHRHADAVRSMTG